MRSEKAIENDIKKYLDSIGAWYFKVHGGSIYQPSGIPDIIGCHNGKFFAFEVKKSDGVVSKLQEYHISGIKRSKGIAADVRSVEEVKELLE